MYASSHASQYGGSHTPQISPPYIIPKMYRMTIGSLRFHLHLVIDHHSNDNYLSNYILSAELMKILPIEVIIFLTHHVWGMKIGIAFTHLTRLAHHIMNKSEICCKITIL